MITIQKINSEIVSAIDVPTIDKSKIKGFQLFDEIYANIFLLAKKKSGKTSTIYKILQSCSNKHTKIIVFASTVHKDANWLAIVKHFEKKKIHIETYTSIFDENGENLIEQLIDSLGLKEEKDDNELKSKSIIFKDNEEENKKESKSKYIVPEFILIFDDLSSELQNRFIGVLFKQNRHYKSKIIIFSQYFNDITKPSRSQIDYILLFPKIPHEKLENNIYPELDLSIPFPIFFKCYKNATKDKFNFLYVDLKEENMRKNFNQKYVIKNIN